MTGAQYNKGSIRLPDSGDKPYFAAVRRGTSRSSENFIALSSVQLRSVRQWVKTERLRRTHLGLDDIQFTNLYIPTPDSGPEDSSTAAPSVDPRAE